MMGETFVSGITQQDIFNTIHFFRHREIMEGQIIGTGTYFMEHLTGEYLWSSNLSSLSNLNIYTIIHILYITLGEYK